MTFWLHIAQTEIYQMIGGPVELSTMRNIT